jgi:hypothetical protein
MLLVVYVGVVPKAAVSNRSKATPYSITSSAAASSVGGTVRLSILAVSALMTSSILLACTTGRSAGLAPLRTAGVDPNLTKRLCNVGTAAEKAAALLAARRSLASRFYPQAMGQNRIGGCFHPSAATGFFVHGSVLTPIGQVSHPLSIAIIILRQNSSSWSRRCAREASMSSDHSFTNGGFRILPSPVCPSFKSH